MQKVKKEFRFCGYIQALSKGIFQLEKIENYEEYQRNYSVV